MKLGTSILIGTALTKHKQDEDKKKDAEATKRKSSTVNNKEYSGKGKTTPKGKKKGK